MTAEVIQIFHINTKVKLNNGKANLEFELIVHENAPKLLENVAFLEISVLDSEEHFIANASCKMREETILESIIIHPHLWQGPLDPYVYKLQANIRIDEKIISKYDTLLPIRTIEMKEESGILLNEKQFPFQGVNYVPRVLDHKVKYSEFLEDLHYFRQLYINAVILEYKNDSLEQWL